MAFNEKDELTKIKAITLSEEQQKALYANTFRCPICFTIPSFRLNLNYDILLTVNITCKCGMKELEINFFLNVYSKDFRGNIQCNDCKEFATKNSTLYVFCLKCEKFVCGECQFDHLTKEEHTCIPFKDVGAICPKHKIYYQAYCKNCEKDICKECYYKKKHDGHQVSNYNSLLLSDFEMANISKNYDKALQTVLFEDTELKKTFNSLLKDEDKFIQNYIIELFDGNMQKNLYILQFFKHLLNLYNNSEHKTYNIIMNIRNNINFDTSSFEIKPDDKINSNTLLNKFYLYSKHHFIAKKPKPFKIPLIKSEMEEFYDKMIESIDLFKDFFNIKDSELKDKGKNIQIQSPVKYKNFIYFGEYIENSVKNKNNETNDNKLIAHGRGILIYKNGDKYFGNFENGKKSKLGIYYFKSGAKYKGYWVNNKLNGYGIYYYTNGNIYGCYFKDNKRNSGGVLTIIKWGYI